MARVFIGTSGWSYQSWRGPFFPDEVMVKHHLQFYATQFDSAELNGVFYRTPTLAAVRGWRDNTPDDFVFAWKASKFITHWKRLSDKSRNSLALIQQRLKILGPKAGPVLFQLPARFTANPERLDKFMHLVPKRWRVSFGALESHRVICLCARPRPDRPVQGALPGQDAAPMGEENPRLEARPQGRLCLFRQ
jgi:uncharacterized protein YecE (DUF72 family)